MDTKQYALPIAIVIAGALFSAATLYSSKNNPAQPPAAAGQTAAVSALERAVLPREGVVLPVSWGGLGARLVSAGAIDAEQLVALYEKQSGFTDEYQTLLSGQSAGKLKITPENAGYLLNLFWALGLANKNQILENKAEMMNPSYGGAGRFASTAGWTISRGDAMSHYNKHVLITLTPPQQELVDKVSRGIFRPCCGNSTHFPDCNHGMAMLGLLELMASQGVGEQDMYKAALAANAYWFPDAYLTIAAYMQNKGIAWSAVSPKEMLGAEYSSAAGFQNILSQVSAPPSQQGSGGCGVEGAGGSPAAAPRQQSGCGV